MTACDGRGPCSVVAAVRPSAMLLCVFRSVAILRMQTHHFGAVSLCHCKSKGVAHGTVRIEGCSRELNFGLLSRSFVINPQAPPSNVSSPGLFYRLLQWGVWFFKRGVSSVYSKLCRHGLQSPPTQQVSRYSSR